MPHQENENSPPKPLPLDQLAWICDPATLGIDTTDDLGDLTAVIGQSRAVEALKFAAEMRRPGYNLFALGPEGTGKHTTLRTFLTRQAAAEPPPSDWCYVHNFQTARNPRALQLEAGQGAAFRKEMSRFVEEVRDALRSSFESEEYRNRRQILEEELKERQDEALSGIEEKARSKDIGLLKTPVGFAFAPLSQGKVIPPEVFNKLPEKDRERIKEEIEELQEELEQALRKAPQWMKETRDRIRQLNDETATFAVDYLIQPLQSKYGHYPEILSHLRDLREDIIANVETIVSAPAGNADGSITPEAEDGNPLFRRYRVNLIVDSSECQQAPVLYEDNPTYDRLLGRVEHRSEMGALVTDFHLIRAGALHKANGGYLIVDARKVLTYPMAWQGLKQAISSHALRIEPMGQAYGLISTVTLEPEEIPLDVKVIMVGERMHYYLLCELDPEFERLFKVAADFDERIDRTAENSALVTQLVATIARKEGLTPFDAKGVARVLEFSAREAGDSAYLSAQVENLSDLLREADYWSRQHGRKNVTSEDVEQAIDSRVRRLDRIRERTQDQIHRGTIVIDTDGRAAGQINALSVLQIGGFAFGRPSRITARVRLGRGEVVDIEREVKLGGPLHSKGVLILSSFLSSRYAPESPLSLSASLVFEQSYGGVDGDSASSTELYALLSALSEVPLRQDLAVTGSVNQHGEVQAIGGVNEKIEGFFDLCEARGLTGNQGVLIPDTNVKHLMLHRRVRDAVAAGKFHIYPIKTVDEGIALLTGEPAGERGEDGAFPEGTVNHRVEERLRDLADKRRVFGAVQNEGSSK